MQQLETKNFIIQNIELSDADFIITLVNSPSWIANIGQRNISNTTESQEYIQSRFIDTYNSYGFAMYGIALRASKELIGICGLILREGLLFPDIGFALLEQYQGQGIGYEAASAILKYECNKNGFDKILAITLPTNIPSKKLLMKLGFRFEDFVFLPQDEEELELYAYQHNKKSIS